MLTKRSKSIFILVVYILYSIKNFAVDGSRYGKPWDVDDGPDSGGSGFIFFIIIFVIAIIIAIAKNKNNTK
jgi:hypothetical protein